MAAEFQASFDSLREYECPEWFKDVKFGLEPLGASERAHVRGLVCA